MSPLTKRLVFFGGAFAVWLVLDLWSKHWADTQLADAYHPLPVQVSEADAGKSLADLLAGYFDLPSAEVESTLIGHVRLLDAPGGFDAGDKVYAAGGPGQGVRGFDVFWRGPDEPPRYLHMSDRRFVSDWLARVATGDDLSAVREGAIGWLEELTFEQWLLRNIAGLSEGDAAEVVAKHTHPVRPQVQVLGADHQVQAGETYLVTSRQIDVMGDWFKFTYAENPGAAFGFLRGLEPGLRFAVFVTLTCIAFVFILFITLRLPASARLIHFAMGGILAGAAGNFVDRIRYGYVIDFIDMDLGFMHWPTYNVADIAIAIGVIILVGDMLFNKQSPLVKQDEDDGASEDEAEAAKA